MAQRPKINPNFTMFIFSDPHSMYRKMTLAKADYYLCTGDISSYGSTKDLEQFNNFAKEVLDEKLCKKFILVPGNHDCAIQDYPEDARKILSNIEVLIDQELIIEGMKAYGSPWSPEFKEWSFMDSDLNLGRYWNKIPNDTELLFTHCPPVGILDRVNVFPFNVGSKTLLQKLAGLTKLKLHCFGHIHQGYGTYSKNGVLYINSALPVMDQAMAMVSTVNPAFLVTISPDSKKVVNVEQVF